MDVSIIEKDLKNNSRNSTEDFLKYILFEMKAPIEDYFLVIDLFKGRIFKKRRYPYCNFSVIPFFHMAWFSRK